MNTPELDKQRALIATGAPEAVQEFIDWLLQKHFQIVPPCPAPEIEHEAWRECHVCEGTGYAAPVVDFESLMAEHFGIDRQKINEERTALLYSLRQL